MSVFHYAHRVTYADCTVGNHIYHSRYLELLEAARGEFFRHLGKTFLEWQEEDTVFPVVECRMRFKSPARYDELLKIEVQVTVAEGVRLSFRHQIMHESGAPVVEAETWHVCTSLQDKPKRLPKELLERLQPYVAGGPVISNQ